MKMCRFAGVVLTVLVCLTPALYGETTGPRSAGWAHLGHTADIRALCHVDDSLWIGTGGGLFIFDLDEARIVDRINAGKTLPSNSVRAISSGRDGVYVGTDEGLVIFGRDSEMVYTTKHPGDFPGARFDLIQGIDFGLDDAIYLSTNGRGVSVLDGDNGRVITREDSLLDDKVFGMVQDNETTFYFATSTGLCAWRDSVWVNFRAGAGIPRAEIRQIVPDPVGGNYLLVADRGVYRFSGEWAERVTYPGLFLENNVAAIAVDTKGDLWACGDYGGIAVYRNEHWTNVEQAEPAGGARRWRSAYADADGGVFFGSADGVVIRIVEDIPRTFRLPAELPSGDVSSVMTDSSGAVFAVSGSYLVRIEGELESISMQYSSPAVVATAVSPSGELWAVTRWGLFRRHGENTIDLDVSLSEREVVYSAAGFDAAGALWVGTQSGAIHRFDGEIWMRLADPGEAGEGYARAFAAHPLGSLWVTSSGGGVARYGNGTWAVFDTVLFDSRPVQELKITPSGTPILATDRGIWGYGDTGEWKPVELFYSGGDGEVPENRLWDPSFPDIRAIEFDQTGRLYVGTDRGVVLVDGSGVRWLTEKDGLGGTGVADLFIEEGKALWVGFKKDGLTRIPLSEIW